MISIGTRRETALHRELKYSYTGLDGQTEVEVAGYVADGMNAGGEYIEVQTGSFAPLRQKAQKIAALGRLRIVYPVIVNKYIEVFDAEGTRLYRRKSGKHQTPWNLFDALVYAPELPLLRGLAIEIALVDAEERRVRDGKGSWRRGGASICDRRMTALHERICLKKPADYHRFLPFANGERFTSALLAEKAGIGADLARKALYVLAKMGLAEKAGKEGNALVYSIAGKKIRKNSRNKSNKPTTT